MIIGLSAGDLILGISLLRDSLQALSNTTGSQQQYLDAVYQLETLEICLKVAQCKLLDLGSTDSRDMLARAITECTRCIDGYQSEIRKYETYFRNEGQTSLHHRCVRELRKIQWLHNKDKTEALSKTIASHVQIITLACSIGSLPQSGNSSHSPTKLSNELAKVLQPSQHVPVSVPRNPRWSLEARLDAAAIGSYPDFKGKRRESADERQRFSVTNSLANSRAASCESLRSIQTLKKVSDHEPNSCCSMSSDGVTPPFEKQGPTPRLVQSLQPTQAQGDTSKPNLDHNEASGPRVPRTTTTAPTLAPSIFSKGSTPAASLFSRRGSDATSITVTSITPSTASTIPWVDGNGVCQNPGCQQRTFLQRKAFSLYARLTHGNGSKESLYGQIKARPTCEHVLLHLQTMQTGCFGGREVHIENQ